MLSPLSPSAIMLLISAVLSVLVLCSYHWLSAMKLPPGPIAYPVIGNLFTIPLKYAWKHFAMVTEYGDLIYYRGFGNSILVLNSLESMHDLLTNKGNTYSDRPVFVVASELMDLIKSTAFSPYGRRWRLHRKFLRIALNSDAVRQYEGTLSDIAIQLNHSLYQEPKAFIDHVRLAAGRVIMSTIYGIDVDSAEDPYIVRAEKTMNLVSKSVTPGAFLVDLIPSLKHLPKWTPFVTFHHAGQRGRAMVAETVQRPFDHVKQGIESGFAKPSFTKNVLTREDLALERKNNEEFETTLKWTAASMYAAGQEVISSALLNMILAMATNPDKLKIAQAELKKVVGSRLPTVADRENLPYIQAIVKETFRWHPPLPMAIARASIQADVYRGYNIPKHTTIIPNIWAVAHAPDNEYPPDKFVPERFLGESHTVDPMIYCFGFGRRMCPGRTLAENAIFLMTANIIKTFDIMHSVDANGLEIPIRVEYSTGLVSLPDAFQCTIIPRDDS